MQEYRATLNKIAENGKNVSEFFYSPITQEAFKSISDRLHYDWEHAGTTEARETIFHQLKGLKSLGEYMLLVITQGDNARTEIKMMEET